MIPATSYDAAIIGGGLAGLAAAIRLRQQGHSVILFEKEKYPFHKVCGEYISMESWNFLQSLGVPLSEMQLPVINTLMLTSPNGKSFTTKLRQGGFGLSRFTLDNTLADIARKTGIDVADETRVHDVDFNQKFDISFSSRQMPDKKISASICLGAFGKRSNLDVKWNRHFITHTDKKLDNYIGVKYHVQTKWAHHLIGLHNFENGYCGISAIEDEKFCLCYLTTATELKKAGNNIVQLQEKLLYQNPHLQKIFTGSTITGNFPVTISQISFSKKTPVEKHMLMTGDAAGMITPLCGNGMSIALHTGKLAADLGHQFLINKISMEEMEREYARQWNLNFSHRLRNGRILQRFFGKVSASNFFVDLFRTLPFLAGPVIKRTHGNPF
jgi:menaquinone-9 beta-reductase